MITGKFYRVLSSRRNIQKWMMTRKFSEEKDHRLMQERVSDEVDVLIVGAGPSGLSAAIRLKQLAQQKNQDLRVLVIEKGPEVGRHILSGAVIEPRALNELFPDWRRRGAPLHTPAKEDKFVWLLNEKLSVRLPTPPQMDNHGNYIASLGNVVRWLGQEAESLGVEIYTGISGSEMVYNEDGSVRGVATNDVGIGKDGKLKDNFERGMELRAKLTLLAEGCRGSLTKTLFDRFNLREGVDPQSFGIGIKELWQVPKENHKKGSIMHTIGWPLDFNTYGGSFLYHLENDQISLGFVVGLDYQNPYLNPYQEFQRFKQHPRVKEVLQGGTPIGYGARAINEGGYQSIPTVIFPGGALIGCTAGFLNVPKIKGSHTAMKSGMLAAEAAFESLQKYDGKPILLNDYPERLKNSWIYEELYLVRNLRPSFHWGLLGGLVYSAIDTYIFRGKAPWTLHLPKEGDHAQLKPAKECKPIEYPKPDGKISFDLLSNLARSGTNHNHDQPAHLKLRNPNVAIETNYALYSSPETRYCPAGVYEIVEESGKPKLQINAQNCLHCKTCDIKDVTQNIDYTTPEGGGGPQYSGM